LSGGPTERRYYRYPARHAAKGRCHGKDVAMATTFWLSMGYNTRCLILGMGFRVKLSGEDIADIEVLRDIAMATFFGFLYRVHIGAIWRIQLNRPCAPAMRPYVKLL